MMFVVDHTNGLGETDIYNVDKEVVEWWLNGGNDS